MNFHPPVLNRKHRATRAGLLCTALLAVTAFTAHAQNTGFGTTTPASKVTVNGNFAVGKPPAVPSGPKSPFITTAAPIGGAIIEGLTGIGAGALLPTNQLHVFAAADPVRFEGLQPGAPADVPLVVTSTGVVKKGAPVLSYEFIQIRSNSMQWMPLVPAETPSQDFKLGEVQIASSPGSPSLFTYTANSITLKPGRRYKLTFNPNRIDFTSPGNPTGDEQPYTIHQFYDVTHNQFFGPTAQFFARGYGAVTGDVTAFLTPVDETTVTMRVKASDNYPLFGWSSGFELFPNLTVETVD